MRMIVALILAVAVGVALVSPVLRAGDDDEQKPSFWMKKKMEYSQEILAGLATEDFDAVAKNARSMNALGQLEKWLRANTPEYRTQLKVFRRANENLIERAEEKNLDGAALAYVQLTLSCVNCHKVVRDQKKQL